VVAAGALSAVVLVAGLGLPALGGLVFLAVLVLGVACWVIGSEDRTDRVSQVLFAWRGNADCRSCSSASRSRASFAAGLRIHVTSIL